jgi:hypothetical protein
MDTEGLHHHHYDQNENDPDQGTGSEESIEQHASLWMQELQVFIATTVFAKLL